MPEQLSVFELVSNASLLVQLVMGLLALASLVSWVMIFQRWFYLRGVLASVDEFKKLPWRDVIIDCQGPFTRSATGMSYVVSYHCSSQLHRRTRKATATSLHAKKVAETTRARKR